MSEEIEVTVEEVICPFCSSKVTANETFCGECGAPISFSSVEEYPKVKEQMIPTSRIDKRGIAERARKGLKSKREKVEQDAIRSGRIAIIVVAVLTFVFNLISYMKFSNEVNTARSNPMMVVDERIVGQTIVR